MKINIRYVAILLLVFFNCNCAYADIAEVVSSLPHVNYATGSYGTETKAGRVVVAKKIIHSLDLFETYLPKLSDASLKIIKEKEVRLKKTRLDDPNYVTYSDEFYKNNDYDNYQIRSLIDAIRVFLNSAINASNTRDEMSSWLYASTLLMDVNSWEHIHDMIQERNLPDVEIIPHIIKMDNLYKAYHAAGSDILIYIINPYIKGKIT
jgi:hypothetical protein